MFAFLFPGQGSQFPGMAYEMYASSKVFRDTIDRSCSILGCNIMDFMWKDGKNVGLLNRTDYTQICIFSFSAAVVSLVEEQYPGILEKGCKIGHSLGEYSALYASSHLALEDALILVKKRGELMHQVSSDEHIMVALLGSDKKSADQFLREENKGFGVMEVANDNSYNQVVISGHRVVWMKIKDKLLLYGFKRSVVLPVSGAFHSGLMCEAAKRMESYIRSTPIFCRENSLFFSSSDVSFMSQGKDIGNSLCKQMVCPVRWTESVSFLLKMGVRSFFELGPGSVLSKLCLSIASKQGLTISCHSVGTVDGLSSLNSSLK